MSDTTISNLPIATAIASPDITAVVQGGVTKRADVSLFGSSSSWGAISGTLSNQTDLQSALDLKENVSDAGTTAKVSSANFSTSNTSLTDITGLSFAASANTLYHIECDLFGQCSGTAGMVIALGFSASGAVGQGASYGITSAGSMTSTNQALGNTSSSYWTTNATDSTAFFVGTVLTGANPGNITMKISKTTSGTVTVKINSRMTVKAF